jgi:hypothetical protein
MSIYIADKCMATQKITFIFAGFFSQNLDDFENTCTNTIPGMAKLWPAGRMRSSKHLCGPCSQL